MATVMAVGLGLGASAVGSSQGTPKAGGTATTETDKPVASVVTQGDELPNFVPADAWQLGWAPGSVVYQVFVRSFADSNGDGVGDLPGLISKLDYLNDGDPKDLSDLDVDALSLMPIFESPSYHGFDVTDYEKVRPAYGTEQDFARLIAEAHKRGMKVILDLPVNPTTPAVRTEIERIAKLWLGRGVDGFRLVAARDRIEEGGAAGQTDTPETHAFFREFAAAVRKANPKALLVGENRTDAAHVARFYGSTLAVGGGDELPMNLNFPLASGIVASVKAGDAGAIHTALDKMEKVYPKGVMDAPLLANHDQSRIATELTNDPARLKLAAAILLTLPGTPFLYYGEELGLQNGPGSKDEFKRTPMPWDATPAGGFSTAKPWFDLAPGHQGANVATETADPTSLLSAYRLLIRARHRSNALRLGTMERVRPVGQPASVLSFLRRYEGARALVVHNLSAVEVEAGPFYLGNHFDPLYISPGVPPPTGGKTGRKVKLPPFSSGVWRF